MWILQGSSLIFAAHKIIENKKQMLKDSHDLIFIERPKDYCNI